MGAERPPRVCFIRHSFYPSELNVKREAEALVKEGYEVSIICLRQEGEKARETIDGVEVFRMPVGHKRGKILRYIFEYNAFFLLAAWKSAALHLRRRFDVVQVNTMPDALVFAALVPKLMGAKVILHMHEPMPELFGTMFPGWRYKWFIGLIKLVEKISLRFADRVLTVTREMRDNFGKRGADVNKITVIVNVPDDDLFSLERFVGLREEVDRIKREGKRRGEFRVFCHGAIEERYGLDLIVRAVGLLEERIPGIRFRFLGKGDYLEEILGLCEEIDIKERVEYLGFVPFEEMVREILSCDVGIVPMRKNPYSVLVHTNKMYEYIAMGKPVIASRLDSVASYFPEDTIVYFEPGNHEDLAEKIFYVYAHPEEIPERMAKVKEIYETYRWNRERKKYLGVYRSLLGRTAHSLSGSG